MKISVLLLAGSILLCGCTDNTLNEVRTSTTLPISSVKWKKVDLNEGRNCDTYVLELQHGWLVYREVGFGGGMAFVPKPGKQ